MGDVFAAWPRRRRWGARAWRWLLAPVLLVSAMTVLTAPSSRAETLLAGFNDAAVVTGLSNPTNLAFASDGRVFVAEKSGVIKVFDSLSDTTPTVFANLSSEVDNYWDRGLLGLALDPSFPAKPYVYVLYTYDAVPGGDPPRWGDACPKPPGPTTDGCMVTGRLSRLTASGDTMVAGSETVLIGQDKAHGKPAQWCQQFPSHSIGDLVFGSDGALYVSAGDGASFGAADWGQYGGTLAGTPTPANPCGDPPSPAGTALGAPGAQGGALRSQSLRRPSGQPVVLNGAILRVDPATGDALASNPLAASADPNARRIVAYGFRNPFRFTLRPGTGELWAGDVGWNTWEEIDRVANASGGLANNFGWPCREGNDVQHGYSDAGLDSCNTLGQRVDPYFTYAHSAEVVGGDGCAPGSSSVTGVAFYQGGAYPSSYDGGLFFADYSRRCIWFMPKGTNGLPDPAQRKLFIGQAASPVGLKIGPGGDLFYPDLVDGTIHRVTYSSSNHAPIAVASATPQNGPVPLDVTFKGSASHDPDVGDTLSFSWDFGDGTPGATVADPPAHRYAVKGDYTATLTVTDQHGASGSASVLIAAGNSAPTPVIDTPDPALRWKVGDTIAFSGHATDPEDGTLPASSLSWSVILHHCSTPTNCHTHVVQEVAGVASGSFPAPDHSFPSYLELRLTATDSHGTTATTSLRLDPVTVALSFATSPSGLKLDVGSDQAATPFSRTVIVGSTNSLTAPSPQSTSSGTYDFSAWSDGQPASHDVVAGAAPATFTASYRRRMALTVGTSPGTTTYGRPMVVVGRLTAAGTTIGVPGQLVSIYRRPDSASPWKRMAMIVTDANGRYAVSWLPPRNYYYQARFFGTLPLEAATSGSPFGGVRPALVAKLSATTVRSGTTVTVSATVNPPHGGQGILLQQEVGGVWKTVQTRTLAASGQATFSIRPGIVTTDLFRVVKPADADHVISISSTLALRVTAAASALRSVGAAIFHGRPI